MITPAQIVTYDGYNLIVRPQDKIGRELAQKHIRQVEIRLVDGRTISADQRRKIYAIIRDICEWNGDEPEWMKEYLKFTFCGEKCLKYFSLSDCEKTVATEFISYLIDFCFYHDICTRDTLLNLTDDVNKYLYSCLENRKCAVCNKRGEVHHVDRVGMGFDREQIVHIGMRAVCLCREHHIKAHENENKLFKDNHIFGIRLDEYLCQVLRLNTKGKNDAETTKSGVELFSGGRKP